MSTTYNIAGGVSPDKSGKSYLPSDAEFAYYALGDAYVDQKKALWLDPVMAIGGLSDGSPSLFTLQDRFADRIFVPEAYTNRHPIILPDGVTGKLAMHFGAGGASPNDLSDSANGVLVCSAGLDAYNVGKSNVPLYAPTQGWAAAFKFRVGSGFNGFTFPTPGGTLLGNAGTSGSTTGVAILIETSGGHLRAFNQSGTTTSGQYLDVSGNLRDNNWHTALVQWDFGAGTLSAWIDPTSSASAAATPQTGVTTDVSIANGQSLPMIGASTATGSSAPNARFQGAISHLSEFSAPLWSSPANRQIAINLLAER